MTIKTRYRKKRPKESDRACTTSAFIYQNSISLCDKITGLLLKIVWPRIMLLECSVYTPQILCSDSTLGGGRWNKRDRHWKRQHASTSIHVIIPRMFSEFSVIQCYCDYIKCAKTSYFWYVFILLSSYHDSITFLDRTHINRTYFTQIT
jgi:hypothetical protein